MCTEILSVIVKCQATKKEFILFGICLSFFMTYYTSCKKGCQPHNAYPLS